MNVKDDGKPKGGMWRAMAAVFWSFLGVRKNRDYAADFSQLTLKQIVVAGLLGGVFFVLSLLILVYFVTH